MAGWQGSRIAYWPSKEWSAADREGVMRQGVREGILLTEGGEGRRRGGGRGSVCSSMRMYWWGRRGGEVE